MKVKKAVSGGGPSATTAFDGDSESTWVVRDSGCVYIILSVVVCYYVATQAQLMGSQTLTSCRATT